MYDRTWIALGALSVFTLLGCPPQQPPGAGTAATTTAGKAAPAPAGELATDEAKTLYALGLDIGNNIDVFNLTPAELELVKQGLSDRLAGVPAKVELEVWGPKLQELAQLRMLQRTEQEKQKAAEYLAKAEKEPGAQKTASGLIFFDTAPGNGPTPSATDTVRLHFRGLLTDGTEFDSSYKKGEPAIVPLGEGMPCWTEAIQKVKVGGKAKVVCPSALAFGDNGYPPRIRGGAALVFEMELLEIVKPEAPAPPDAPGMTPGEAPTPDAPALPTPPEAAPPAPPTPPPANP